MLELTFDDSVHRGLHRYTQLITRALGLHGECSYIQADEPATAYIALDGQLSRYPGRDVALLWDEYHGWSVGVETHSAEDVLLVTHFDHGLLPRPEDVAAWVRGVLRTERTADDHVTDILGPSGDGPVRHRLASFAFP